MAITSLRGVFVLVMCMLLLAPDRAAADFVIPPSAVGAAGWDSRRDPALADLCLAESMLGSTLTEDGTDVALAKLVKPSCKRCSGPAPCPTLGFEPDPAKPLGHVDLGNAW